MKDEYEKLAMAIVKQAAMDYKKVLSILRYDPHDKKALIERESLERFFRSRWFSILCNLDGEELMQMVRTRRLRLEVEK